MPHGQAGRGAPRPENRFKASVESKAVQLGIWSSLTSPLLAELISLSSLDFVLFDMEHAPNDLMQLIAQLHAIKGSALHPVVRVPDNDPVQIKRVLDIGISSVVVPSVESAAEAERAVAATRYPPAGVRGMAGAHRASLYGTISGYVESSDDCICVICQIESREAAGRVEEIGQVAGVTAVFVGPKDLAASMGHTRQPNHPDVIETIARVGRDAREAEVPAGIVAEDASRAQHYFELGYTVVTVGSDVRLFRDALANLDKQVNASRQRKPS